MLALAVVLAAVMAAAAAPPGPSAGSSSAAADSALGERIGRAIAAAINDTTLAARTAREVFAAQALADGGEARAAGIFPRLARYLRRVTYHHSEMTVHRGGDAERRSLHVYVRAASDSGWKDLQFWLDPQPPHGVLSLVFVADVTEPVYLPPVGFESPEGRAWANRFVDRMVRDYGLSGAALVAFGDSIVLERYFGTEDVAGKRPVTTGTRFSLGSGNKMFTAIAIARLAGAGRLSYTDSIAKYFPDFPDPALARRITIHHLLSHQSGWGEIWTDEWVRDSRTFTRLEQHLPYVYRVGPLGQVGERHYCNSNYILLGLIIERVTGEDYIDHVGRTLTRPLGLDHTRSRGVDSSGAGFAERMTGKRGDWKRGVTGRQGTSAGGGYSTPRDMLRFARALQNGGVVDGPTLRTLVEPKAGVGASLDPYGYGFIPRTLGGAPSYGHGGTAPGVNFELRVFPREKATVIVFSNQDNGAYDDLRKTLLKLVSGER